MTKLSELLDKGSLDSIARNSIDKGNVYRIKMDRSNGITPPHGDPSRNKFFVVLGFDSQGNVFGGVIINSRINPRVPQSVRDWQMPLSSSRYNFLRYDSFVDCSKLKTVKAEKFPSWKLLGTILPDDLQTIISTVRSSPNETVVRLKAFGLF